MRRSGPFGVCVLGLGLALPAASQEHPLELSLDGGVSLVMVADRPNMTVVGFPWHEARLGVGLTPSLSLEGVAVFEHYSQGSSSATGFAIAPGLVYHFRPFAAGVRRPYVGALGVLRYNDGTTETASGGDTQFGVGGGVGIKVPITSVAFLRVEGRFVHYFKTDHFVSANTLTLGVGLGAVMN